MDQQHPLTRPLTTFLSQEHHHLEVRSKSRGVRRSAKGTLGFPDPLQAAAGGAVASMFPMRSGALKGRGGWRKARARD
jgi:hypothetical protein